MHARAMNEMLLLASLALLSRAPLSGSSDYEYVWSARAYGQSRCTEIPRDLRLCHGIGYTQMLLPNLLEHDSMAEVKQQASSWVPLVHRKCHVGTQVFLCSLFAPVCLEKPVRPCQLLCESVRDACSPIMEAFGFVWPEMLNCDRFPREENEMCISNNDTKTLNESEHMSACPPCDIVMNTDFFLENMCASEFAIKAKIKKTKPENGDKKVILQKRKKAVWNKDLNNQGLKKLVLYLKNGAHCPCTQLDNTGQNYLIMGRKVGQRYLLTGIHHWDEESADFQKLLNQIQNHQCPTPDMFF
ncbi:Secreted frizzled-related protein 1 [Bagarius yarrelli]|uniref:Secreted frizzled-related protein 1 n=1 Tax=Bagarius yarrelli TaxID=175774 RepID=A0A556U2T4_BAGYA|nr:Secreted frizzled-related protein 1 [Bagarius yarrelli]